MAIKHGCKAGPWVEALGLDPRKVTRLEAVADVHDAMRLRADMLVTAEEFKAMTALPIAGALCIAPAKPLGFWQRLRWLMLGGTL